MASLPYADGRGSVPQAGSLVGWLLALRSRWARARRARRELLTLRNASDHILSDIGITRAELERALSRPVWHSPADRLPRHR